MPNCNRFLAALLVSSISLFLQACGGSDDPSGAHRISQTWAWITRAAAQAAPNHLPGTEGRKRVLATQGTIDPDLLLDWAERNYPELFPKGPTTGRLVADGVAYTVRHYAASGNYLGVADDGGVWGYGPFTSNTLRSYGHVSGYTCLVSPGLCEPRPAVCRTEISGGFAGDLNATYQDGGSGVDGDGSDGGSAGVGGSEGKVLGGRIRVIRLSDGEVLGEGITDSSLGLTTIKWCKADLPLMLELRGASGAKYFDEAQNALVDFPITQKLRALVERFDENIGVSALTEAAYLYAMNNIVNDPNAIAAGRALVSDGVPVGITAQQVAQSNSIILAETNRLLTKTRQIRSVKSLGTPIGPGGLISTLPANQYGLSGLFAATLAKQSRISDISATRPALVATKQISEDLSDGRLDGFSKAGNGVFAGSNQSYQPGRLPLSLDYAGYQMAGSFSEDALFRLGSGISELNVLNLNLPSIINGVTVTSCGPLLDIATIGRDGSLSVERQRYTGFCDALESVEVIPRFATTATKLSTSGGRSYFLDKEGKVFGWGRNFCGTLGNKTEGGLFDRPVQIPGLEGIAEISAGQWFVVARSSDGSVFTWGSNTNGVLGVGNNPASFDIPNCNAGTGRIEPGYSPATSVPKRIAGLPPIVSLSTLSDSIIAIDFEGGAWQWSRVVGSSALPKKLLGLPPLLSVTEGVTTSNGQIGQNGFYGLSIDGSVLKWSESDYRQNTLQTASINVSATKLTEISDITQIVSPGETSDLVGLLRRDGTVSIISLNRLSPHTPEVSLCEDFQVRAWQCKLISRGPIPKMKHLASAGSNDALLMYGFDGDIYFFSNTRSQLRTLVPPSSKR